ncbi:MAG TPA: c-type cytochrome [Terriglobia bacterium]|nr:c-type cytochrome [Terriglobia bacterium]
MTKALFLILAFSFAVALSAQKPARTPKAVPGGAAERGRYLVEDVGMCGECHSPRDAQGNLDRARWLQGAPTWFTPVHAMRNWAYTAPALAGLPSFSDADMTNILEKGLTPEGAPIRPPMHVYHMTHEDAAAIAAYLRSLKPAGGE